MKKQNASGFGDETKIARAKRARTVKGVPTAVGLFVGGGGLDLGFRQAGYRLLLASDVDPYAERTHQANNPDIPFLRRDIRELTVDEILNATKRRRPDVIIGGPPCQGFSTLGDRLSADPRNDLVAAFLRIVNELRPQAVVIENVRAIVTEYKGRYRDYIIEKLASIGYAASCAVLNAADYGVPQLRNRAFFVAFADPRIEYVFPKPTHGPTTGVDYITVGEAIDDLASCGPDVPNHTPLAHSEIVVARYKLIRQGGMLPPPEKLPIELRRSNFGSTYKRLDSSKPSLTIVPGNNAFPIHPSLHRSLTPREAARIQSFPDNYVFEGDRRRQCILVGNAVPPPLARALAKSVAERILPLKGAIARTEGKNDNNVVELHAAVLTRNDPPKARRRERGFVDLFSGAGGFSIGFARAGLVSSVAADNNKQVAATHRKNYPETPFVLGDLGLPETQHAVLAAADTAPFAVVGGPPCQGFSVFGQRRRASKLGLDPRMDPRNRLVFSFVDTVAKLKPRWVVMENVSGFASLDGGSFVNQVVKELQRVGYTTVEWRILDAADYGVPQRRKRFVLIGNRTGHIIPWPKRKFFENPEDWQKPYRTVGEAITDLADPSSYARYTSHVPMNHKPNQVARFSRIPEGGKLDVDALPQELRKGYRTPEIKNFSHVFKRLHRARPSFTLVPGHNAFPIHPWLDRALTVREAARIQTFPDEIAFCGPREDQGIQVGNAFPPLLAELIANNLIKAETNKWFPESIPKLARYSLLDLAEHEELPLFAARWQRIGNLS